jgi:hypothetical protein
MCMPANGNCAGGSACRQCQGDVQCPTMTGICP